jgi:hypothetical protein
MKQYLIDELRLEDHEKIKAYLDEHIKTSPMAGLYWILLEKDLLTGIQAAHPDCGPHYFALELHEDRLACELLVRAEQSIRCNCICYASKEQRDGLIEYIDAILEKLEISI